MSVDNLLTIRLTVLADKSVHSVRHLTGLADNLLNVSDIFTMSPDYLLNVQVILHCRQIIG